MAGIGESCTQNSCSPRPLGFGLEGFFCSSARSSRDPADENEETYRNANSYEPAHSPVGTLLRAA